LVVSIPRQDGQDVQTARTPRWRPPVRSHLVLPCWPHGLCRRGWRYWIARICDRGVAALGPCCMRMSSREPHLESHGVHRMRRCSNKRACSRRRRSPPNTNFTGNGLGGDSPDGGAGSPERAGPARGRGTSPRVTERSADPPPLIGAGPKTMAGQRRSAGTPPPVVVGEAMSLPSRLGEAAATGPELTLPAVSTSGEG